MSKKLLFILLLSLTNSSFAKEEKKIDFSKSLNGNPSFENMKKNHPVFAEMTRDILYQDVWNRPPLSQREKSMITIALLIAGNRIEQMESHFKRALNNGVTREELNGIILHAAYYTGWPTAVSALNHLQNVLENSNK